MNKNWSILKNCLLNEEGLCFKSMNKEIKERHLERAIEYQHNLETVRWVLEEMENIEENGTTL